MSQKLATCIFSPRKMQPAISNARNVKHFRFFQKKIIHERVTKMTDSFHRSRITFSEKKYISLQVTCVFARRVQGRRRDTQEWRERSDIVKIMRPVREFIVSKFRDFHLQCVAVCGHQVVSKGPKTIKDEPGKLWEPSRLNFQMF